MDSMPDRRVLLFDVGGTFIKAGAADASGELIPDAEFSLPIRSEGLRFEIEEALTTAVRQGAALARARGQMIGGIGMAFPGPFDYANGIPLMTHKFAGIYGVSLRELLGSLPQTGGIPIRFMHDVNAALLGELTRGNARGFANTALVTLGTGLGFALSRGSRVQYAPAGSPLITIYRNPCREGILEDYLSKRGFLRLYAQVTGRRSDASLTVADLGRMAGEGDAAARETFDMAADILAQALRDVLEQQQVECLLLGGQIARSFAWMEPRLGAGLEGLKRLKHIAAMRHIGQAAFYGLLARMGEVDN